MLLPLVALPDVATVIVLFTDLRDMGAGPPPPKGPRRLQTVRALPLSQKDVNIQSSQPLPPPKLRPISVERLRAHDRAMKEFDAYLKEQHIVHDGQQYKSAEQWFGTGLTLPSPSILHGFLDYYVASTSGLVDEREDPYITALTLLNFYITFVASIGRRHGLRVDSEARKNGLVVCKAVIREFGLTFKSRKRAHLDIPAVRAITASLYHDWKRIKTRRRLSMNIFVAVSTQTGARPSTISRGRGEATKALQGACYGDFDLAAFPGTNGYKTVRGFFNPRWGKTHHSRGLHLPLPPAPRILESATLLLLVAAYLDGVFSREAIERFLDPKYLRNKPFTEISWPSTQ